MLAIASSRLCVVTAVLVLSSACPAMSDWPPDGLPLCTAAGDQNTPMPAVPDDQGGTIFFWFDRRSPARDALYAQRVDASGSARWGVNGVAIRGENVWNSFDVATDGNGGAFVAWVDRRKGDSNPDIYAQRVDGNGTLLWGDGGAPVCTSMNAQYYPHLTYDGFGGVAIVGEDFGNGESDIFAQRLDPSGDPYWTQDGVPVCTVAGSQDQGQAVSDGNGGIIVAWKDARSETVAVYVQRLSFFGTPRWTRGGVTVTQNVRDGWLRSVVSDAMGGAILVWDNLESFGDSDVFAQRIDASGAKLWQPEGVIVCNASFVQHDAHAVADGAGGALIAWTDHRTAGDNIYAQRLDAQGLPLWAANGARFVPQ